MSSTNDTPLEDMKNQRPETSDDQRNSDAKLNDQEKGGWPTEGGEQKAVNPWHPSQFPDGGRDANLVLLGAFCSMFCSFGYINCIGIFQDYYQTHQLRDYSPSSVSWISSLQVFMMFASGPVIGKLYDDHGPRYLLLTGTILEVLGLMMTSISKEYYQFILAQGICTSLGTGFNFYATIAPLTTWFFKKRGMAFGIAAAGSSLGGVILPIMVDHLIPQVGFGWAMRAAGFLILGLLIIANFTVKSRLPPRPRPFNIMDFITPMTELPYALTVSAAFLFSWGLFLPINYIQYQATVDGMSSSLARYLIPILNATSLFGRTIPGFLSDKVGRYNMQTVLSYFSGIIVLALWLPAKSNAPLIVFASLYGFSSGAYVSLIGPQIAQITPNIQQIGVRSGLLFALMSVAGLAGSPVAGAIISRENGSFRGLQIFCGVMLLAGAAMFTSARISLVGFKIKAKV